MPLLEHVTVLLPFHSWVFHCMSEFFPGDGVIKFPHGTSLWDVFKNCRIHGAVIVEDIVEMRSEEFHVLGGIGRLVPIRESHCHVRHLVVMRCFAFGKETNVLPC